MIPTNPVVAAATGTLIPLVLFTVAFAIVVGQLAPDRRASVVGFFRGAGDAMLTLVPWVLWLARAGVFALDHGLGAPMELARARVFVAFVAFVVLVAVVCLAFLIALYALAVAGGVPVTHFARPILRALIEASETTLALPPRSRASCCRSPSPRSSWGRRSPR